jgi:hypothetical protein
MSFYWVTPPENLAKRIEEYGKQLLVAVHAVAVYVGQSMQDDARRGAPWQDRTGNARSGLFFAVDGFGLSPISGTVIPSAEALKTDFGVESGDDQTLILTLGHTVYYGRYLELSNGGVWGICMSTLESHLPQLERMLKELLR